MMGRGVISPSSSGRRRRRYRARWMSLKDEIKSIFLKFRQGHVWVHIKEGKGCRINKSLCPVVPGERMKVCMCAWAGSNKVVSILEN